VQHSGKQILLPAPSGARVIRLTAGLSTFYSMHLFR